MNQVDKNQVDQANPSFQEFFCKGKYRVFNYLGLYPPFAWLLGPKWFFKAKEKMGLALDQVTKCFLGRFSPLGPNRGK